MWDGAVGAPHLSTTFSSPSYRSEAFLRTGMVDFTSRIEGSHGDALAREVASPKDGFTIFRCEHGLQYRIRSCCWLANVATRETEAVQ